MQSPEELQSAANTEIAGAMTTSQLREIEQRYLGKSGSIPGLMKQLGALPKEDRPSFGQRINGSKAQVESLLQAKLANLKAVEQAAQFEAERIDVTLPGERPRIGQEHILQQTTNKIKRVLGGMGFIYQESPELEQFRYNFDALNYPPDHPAMDDQDTFYIDDTHLLRTQCTALQGRVFETTPPPYAHSRLEEPSETKPSTELMATRSIKSIAS